MNCAKFVAQLHVLAEEEGCITSLASSGDVVFVGTSRGYVHRYEICRGVSDDREIYSTLTHRTSLLRPGPDNHSNSSGVGDPSIRRVAKLQHVTPSSTTDLVSSLQRKLNATVTAWVNAHQTPATTSSSGAVSQQQPDGGSGAVLQPISLSGPHSQRFVPQTQPVPPPLPMPMTTQPPTQLYMQDIESKCWEEYITSSIEGTAHTAAISDEGCAAISEVIRSCFETSNDDDQGLEITPEAIRNAIVSAVFDRNDNSSRSRSNVALVRHRLKDIPWSSTASPGGGGATADQGKDRTDVGVKRHLARLLGIPMYKLDSSPSLLCAMCHKRVYLIDSSTMEIVYQVCPATTTTTNVPANPASPGSPGGGSSAFGASFNTTIGGGGMGAGAMDAQPGHTSQMLIGNGIAAFSLSLSTVLLPSHATDRILFLKHAQHQLDSESNIESSLQDAHEAIIDQVRRLEAEAKAQYKANQDATLTAKQTSTLEALNEQLERSQEAIAVQQSHCHMLRKDLLRAYHTVFINPGSGPVFCYTLSCAMYQKREVQVLQLSTTADLASFKLQDVPGAQDTTTINERHLSDTVAATLQASKLLNMLHANDRRRHRAIERDLRAPTSFDEANGEDDEGRGDETRSRSESQFRPRGQSFAPIGSQSVPSGITATRTHTALLCPLMRLIDSAATAGDASFRGADISALVVPSCVSLWYPLPTPVALLQELILPESVQSIAEFNGVVCVGLHREYSILSLVDGDARSLLPIPPTLRQTQYQRLQNLLTTEIQQRKEDENKNSGSPSRSTAPTSADFMKWRANDELSYYYHNNVPPQMLSSTKGGIQRVDGELSSVTAPYKDGFVEGGPGMPSLTINERSNEAYLRLGSNVFVVNLRAMPSLSVTSSSSSTTTAAIAAATLLALSSTYNSTSQAIGAITSIGGPSYPLTAGTRTSGLDATMNMASVVFTSANLSATSQGGGVAQRTAPQPSSSGVGGYNNSANLSPSHSAAVAASVTIEKAAMLPYARFANAVDTTTLAHFNTHSYNFELMFGTTESDPNLTPLVSPLLVGACVSSFSAISAVLQVLRASCIPAPRTSSNLGGTISLAPTTANMTPSPTTTVDPYTSSHHGMLNNYAASTSSNLMDDAPQSVAPSSTFLKKTLRFDSEPRTLVSAHPFLFAFCADGCAVYSVYDDELVEELPIPGVCFVSQSVHSNTILCASRKKLWLLQCASLDDQLEQLVLRPNHVEDAFDLLQHKPPSSTVFCQPMIVPGAGVVDRVEFAMYLEHALSECYPTSYSSPNGNNQNPLEGAARTKLMGLIWALAADILPPHLHLKNSVSHKDAVNKVFTELVKRNIGPLMRAPPSTSLQQSEADADDMLVSKKRFTSLSDLLTPGTIESSAIPQLMRDRHLYNEKAPQKHHTVAETAKWASEILADIRDIRQTTACASTSTSTVSGSGNIDVVDNRGGGGVAALTKLVKLQQGLQQSTKGLGYHPSPEKWAGASEFTGNTSETKRPVASPAELEANLHVCSGLGYLYRNVPSDATRHLGVYVDVREILLHIPDTVPNRRRLPENSDNASNSTIQSQLDHLTYHSTDEHEELFWSGFRPKHPHNRLLELYNLYEVLNVVQVAAYSREEELQQHGGDGINNASSTPPPPPLPPLLAPSQHEVLQVLHAGWCDAYYANGTTIDPATGSHVMGDTTGTSKRQFDITNFPHHMQSLMAAGGNGNGSGGMMVSLSTQEYLQISMDSLKAELLSWLRSRLPTAGPFQRRAIEYALLVLYLQTRDLRSAFKVVSESEFLKVADCWNALMGAGDSNGDGNSTSTSTSSPSSSSIAPEDRVLRARLMLLLIKKQLGIHNEATDMSEQESELITTFYSRYVVGSTCHHLLDVSRPTSPMSPVPPNSGDNTTTAPLPSSSLQYSFLQGGSQWGVILHDVIRASHEHFSGIALRPVQDSTNELFYALESGDFEYVSEVLIGHVDDHSAEVLKQQKPFIHYTTDILGNNGFHIIFRQIVNALLLAQAVENEAAVAEEGSDGGSQEEPPVGSIAHAGSLIPLGAALATMTALLHHGALCTEPIHPKSKINTGLSEFERLAFAALSSPASLLLLVTPNNKGSSPLGFIQAMSAAGVEAVERSTAKQLGMVPSDTSSSSTKGEEGFASAASLPHPETIVIPAILAHLRMMALPL